MTEINQRAIVHTLPLMRQPIDTGFRRESKGGRHGKRRREGKEVQRKMEIQQENKLKEKAFWLQRLQNECAACLYLLIQESLKSSFMFL